MKKTYMKHMEMEEYKRHDEAYGDGWDMKKTYDVYDNVILEYETNIMIIVIVIMLEITHFLFLYGKKERWKNRYCVIWCILI